MCPDPNSLAGVTVLVTRPGEPGAALCREIADRAGRPIHFPTIAVEAIAADAPLCSRLHAITDLDVVIFVSRPAVEHGMALLRQCGAKAPAQAFAVGTSTAALLSACGVTAICPPAASAESEGLLQLEALQEQAIRGRRVFIFRGCGGREELAETLGRRGARVEYAEVYRRKRVAGNLGAAFAAAGGHPPDILVVTSVEIVEALAESIRAQNQHGLFSVPLVSFSRRIADRAAAAGFTAEARVTAGADNAAIIDALLAWRRQADLPAAASRT